MLTKKKRKRFNAKAILSRTLKFTETVVVQITILYFLNWLVSVALIIVAIKETSNFAYLDTLITEVGTTFREVVGVAVIKFGVENIFKYNDFGGRLPNKSNDEQINETQYNETISNESEE